MCPPTVAMADLRAHEDFTGYGQCAQLAQLVVDFWAALGRSVAAVRMTRGVLPAPGALDRD